MTPFCVLSLGWGVQSWTIAAMAALGELPRFDAALHADTTWEHSGTVEFRRRWEPWLIERGIRVVTVRADHTEVVDDRWSTDAVQPPVFTLDPDTGSRGQTRRQCTYDWKIQPIRRWIRSQIADPPKPGMVESWQGITMDEWHRMRDSDVKYIVNRYPLIEGRMTRADCILWLQHRGLEVPGKSACVFCPYKSLSSWRNLKRAGGSDWRTALDVDADIRDRRPAGGRLYLHPGRIPLDSAVRIPEDEGAMQLELDFERPCDGGHCFV